LDAFLCALQASALCDEQQFQQLDGDALVQLYDDTVTALLNEQAPVRRVSYRVRASSLWFDEECRIAKRALRLSERPARRAGLLSQLLPEGVSASMFTNRSHVSFGGRLIKCLAEAKIFCHLILMRLPSISSSTTRLPVFGQLLRTQMNLGSLQSRSGVSSVSIPVTQSEIIDIRDGAGSAWHAVLV